MSDLIERLRNLNKHSFIKYDDFFVGNEAADELKRLQEELAALKASTEQWNETMRQKKAWADGKDAEPVAQVIDDGTPEGSIKWVPFSRIEPLKTGDKLYTTPPTALVEQKCLEVAGAVWALAAPDKVVDSKALIAVVHRVMREEE